jgi:hypothetical protein
MASIKVRTKVLLHRNCDARKLVPPGQHSIT